MVAGAEGERGFDLDCDAVRGDARPIMRAMNREASRLDWGEGGEALAHPVDHRQRLEFQRRCCLRAVCCRDQLADRRLIGGTRKCSSIDERPSGSSKIEVATASVSNFAVIASLILPAIAASVASRATVVDNWCEKTVLVLYFPILREPEPTLRRWSINS